MEVSKTTDGGEKVSFRRLLLSKQIYLHGLEHSNKPSTLDHMIAVHNFHNSIEIVLRAIFLKYEIRAEKELNIDFEVMLKEIDKFFKGAGKKLPYRQELVNLNKIRNMVQHHGIEPPKSTMDEWRVFSKRFLIKAFNEYFDENFDDFSASSLINDDRLKQLIEIASSKIEKSNWLEAIIFIRVSFDFAGKSVVNELPLRKFLSRSLHRDVNMMRGKPNEKRILDNILGRIDDIEAMTIILLTNINLRDLKRLEEYTPRVKFFNNGKPHVPERRECTEDTTRWAYDFVVDTIIKWQLQSFNPKIEKSDMSAFSYITSEDGLKDLRWTPLPGQPDR